MHLSANYRLIRACQPVYHLQSRTLFRWLTIVFNRVDEKKIKSLGAERAAAEWLIRNGAQVKWTNGDSFMNDYQQVLNDSTLTSACIQEIDATKSSISHVGFPYLKNLKCLSKLILRECNYVEDKALDVLSQYQIATLKHLEIIACYNITNAGISSLHGLKSLKCLKLEDLPSIKNRPECYIALQDALHDCQIEWN